MNLNIQILLDLQNEDREVLSLKSELERLRSQIYLCHKESEQLKESLKSIDESVLYQESQKKLKELELTKHQDHVESLKRNLKESRNNKEYTALNSQIKLLEVDIRKVEEEILKIMETIEDYSNQKKEIDEKIIANQNQAQELEAGIENEVQEIESGISEHIQSREQYAKQLEEGLCQEYEKLFDRYQGEAVCEIEDAACMGCYMTLSSSYANKLSVGKEIVRCPSCGRLLFKKETK